MPAPIWPSRQSWLAETLRVRGIGIDAGEMVRIVHMLMQERGWLNP